VEDDYQLILTTPPKRISRDEMNLAEFPLTVLSTRHAPGVKTLEFTDTIKGKNGDIINRSWIITGADKFGLPTSTDDEILLGLLKLTVDNGFGDRKIYFTRYELLRILRWTTEGRSYERLQKALDRLTGVRIKATNAFYDNESKSHSTRNFGLIDAYEINDGRDTAPKPSFFIWSEVLFKSFQVGFIKKFDLDLYLGFRSAVSKRLYRYLDKHFWYKARIQINLFTLSHEKIGISRNYKYASSLRQQLDPALEELIERGVLARAEYSGKGQGTEVILFAGSGKPRSLEKNSDTSAEQARRAVEMLEASELDFDRSDAANATNRGTPRRVAESVRTRASVDSSESDLRQNAASPLSSVEGERGQITSLLVDRGLKPAQVARLLDRHGEATLKRIAAIVEHFDELCASGSRLVSRSPVGFLYRAVERPDDFILPGERRQPSLFSNSQATNFQTSMPARAVSQGANSRSALEDQVVVQKSSKKAGKNIGEYLTWFKHEITRLMEEMEPKVLASLRSEVENALVRMKGLISEEHFSEAVRHGVEKRVAKFFSVPDLEEWSNGRRSLE
jgi:Replication initiator protein A